MFLQFEGQTLTMGNSDATQNTARWLSMASATLPQWQPNAANRLTRIQGIVAQMFQALCAFDVEIVTTRPAAGPYDMIVIGGQSASAGLPPGTLAVSATDCGVTNPSVSWVGDVGLTDIELANYGLTSVGITNELGGSKVLPSAPYRQWVFAVPKRLRLVLEGRELGERLIERRLELSVALGEVHLAPFPTGQGHGRLPVLGRHRLSPVRGGKHVPFRGDSRPVVAYSLP